MVRPTTIVAGLVLLVVLAGLWLFPGVVFPNPGTNDAIGLSDAELPLLLLGLIGAVVALFVFRGPNGTVVKVALGVLLVGAAIDLVIGLLVFGNLSNDRFAALLFIPPPMAVVGLTALVVGIATSGLRRADLLRGAGYGLVAAVFVGAWTLVRGSRDWLLAPYGFDVVLMIIVVGAGLAVLSTRLKGGSRG